MHIKLQHGLLKKIFLLIISSFLTAAVPVVCFSQTDLSPGDLVVVHIHSGSPTGFEFVPLVTLEEGTVIYFTDNAYVSASGLLTKSENTLIYTAPQTIRAGTVISYSREERNGFTGTGLEAGMSGDNILVYQSAGSDITYIYGIGWGVNPAIWTHNSSSGADAHSDIPPGLSTEKHTIVSLRAGVSFTYDMDRGLKGTRADLISLVANNRNWRSAETALTGHGDISFTPINSPVLRFTRDRMSVSESGGSIILSVELVENSGKDISADVVFVPDLSTTSEGEIGGFTTQTVSFSKTDDVGTTKNVTINIANNNVYNGGKVAVFRLRSTGGSVVSPQILKVEINDKDVPAIVINEINADPGNDADGNGVIDSSDDEFVEFVNNERVDVDISGWTFSDDGTRIRHVFPAGTVLPAGGALVLFANEEIKPAGSFGGAIIQNSNRSPALHLNDRGDSPALKNTGGVIVSRYTYVPEASNKQSLTRNPDISGNFTKHSTAAGSDLLVSSPGTRIDGSPFGSTYSLGIHAREGWRAISIPTRETSFKDLFDGFRIQGISGSDAPSEEATIYFWDETTGGTMVKPVDIANEMVAGVGYLVYIFKDNEAGAADVQGNLPNVVSSDKTENVGSVSVPVSATDADGNSIIDENEGFNLLGNPFGTYISVTAVLDALEKVDKSLNRNILVWDHTAGEGNGAYKILTDGDLIAPFQAFFVRFTAEMSGTAVLNKNELQAGRTKNLYKEPGERNFGFEIRLNDGTYHDTYHLSFRDEGSIGQDKMDAYKLFSLNPKSVNLFSRESTGRFAKNVLPGNLDAPLEVPLLFKAPEDRTSLEFAWKQVGKFPEDWNIVLRDTKLNKDVDLKNNSEYSFTYTPEIVRSKSLNNNRLLINDLVSEDEEREPRFVLSINPALSLTSGREKLPESVKLNPNYPNPFNSTTTIPFELAAEAEIKLSIWNIVGQKVATLIDGIRDAGLDEVVWNAADMPSGIYIAQLEVGGNVYIRKMTLIKY